MFCDYCGTESGQILRIINIHGQKENVCSECIGKHFEKGLNGGYEKVYRSINL